MKIERIEHVKEGTTDFILTIADTEFAHMKLRLFDSALLDECASSDKVSDKLLALETIARRIEETTRKKATTSC